MPEPTFDAAGHGRYEGVVEFRRKARVIPSAYHQACDAFSRRVPKLKSVDIPFEVTGP